MLVFMGVQAQTASYIDAARAPSSPCPRCLRMPPAWPSVVRPPPLTDYPKTGDVGQRPELGGCIKLWGEGAGARGGAPSATATSAGSTAPLLVPTALPVPLVEEHKLWAVDSLGCGMSLAPGVLLELQALAGSVAL